MAGDLPIMASSSYISNTFDTSSFAVAGAQTPAANAVDFPNPNHPYLEAEAWLDARRIKPKAMKAKQEQQSMRRIVQVIIIDPNDSVPLDKCVLYKGEQKLTDLTDQELYFELDMKGMVDKHNEFRVTCRNKAIKDRVEMLEPVKIRELKMVVVNVANF